MAGDERTRLLVKAGLIAGPVFVATFLIAGAVRTGGYDPLKHPVSSLQLGATGWVQTANFLIAGALAVACGVGLWRSRPEASRAVAALIGVWGIGLIGAGLFRTDPVSGYPAGTSEAIEYTTLGILHDAFSLPAFIGLFASMVVYAIWSAKRRSLALAAYSGLSALVFLGMFVLASAGFSQTAALVDTAGLFQRIAVIVGWAWIAVVAHQALNRPH
ncbi:DUF998 domain-containing protein [Kribbella deserti]|uniref:DUF998 domain-containing protein n=1 Tax=Kribbella deserti TaxID=1926257 RepID=A0ABV6QW85_9ACTN